MDALLNTKTTSKKSRGAIIAAAIGAAICIAVAPLLTPQADASLSNGNMCITASYDADPEFKGMAGNCKPEARLPIALDQDQTYISGWDLYVYLNTDSSSDVALVKDGERVMTSRSSATLPALIELRVNGFDPFTPATYEACYLDADTDELTGCVDLKLSELYGFNPGA